MRPWIIVLSSALGATAVTTALAVHERLDLPPSEWAPHLVSSLPILAVAGLAVYALCAMLMVTSTLLAGILRVRRELETGGPVLGSGRRDWVVILGANGFRQLALKLGLRSALADNAEGNILRTCFTASEIRGEFASLHYMLLARAHFFSALIVLAGIIGLGLAQDRGWLPFPWGTIPTMSGTLVLMGLVLLTVLGRIAFDVTAEPLLDAVLQVPAERVEFDLLRRAVDLLERIGSVAAVSGEREATAPAQLPDRLLASIEQGHHALLDAVERLSASSQALGATMQSSAQTIETSIRMAAAEQQQMGSERSPDGGIAFPELQAAVEGLTAVLQRLSAASEMAEDVASPPDAAAARRTASPPRLARELRSLLQEIDASR